MIAESYDLDLICYFPSENDKTLKEIHNEVQNALSEKYSVERTKASAVRGPEFDNDLETDYHIDVSYPVGSSTVMMAVTICTCYIWRTRTNSNKYRHSYSTCERKRLSGHN